MKTTSSDKSKYVIVAFGNSITLSAEQTVKKRWCGILQELLNKKYSDKEYQVINAGVGGNTSREGLNRIENDVIAKKPNLVLIEFGGNDSTYELERHVSSDEFRSNLADMAKRISDETGSKIVMLTFTPLIDSWHICGSHDFYKNAGGPDSYIESYRQITRDFAADNGYVYVDIDLALRNAINRNGADKYILPDGVHLTDESNRIVAEFVFEAIQLVIN
jgi:lysophospholipase L1-like esterase